MVTGKSGAVRMSRKPKSAHGTITFESLEPRVLLSVVSDEFNSGTLNSSLWQFVDPRGDSGLVMTGTAAEITVGAGAEHDLWPGQNFAAELLQPGQTGDFTIESKFDSVPVGQYALKGLVVQSDAQNFLRFNIQSTGVSTLTLYGASFTNNSPKVLVNTTIASASHNYLRVGRTGNQWNLWYSSDGATWTNALTFTRAMTVNAVGPFVGNAAASAKQQAPGFVGKIDYFRATGVVPPPDTRPPVQSNIQVSPGPSTIDITWTTDELASGKVQYGLTNQYELGTLTEPGSPVLSHRASLTGLAAGTLYHFRVVSTDASGNTAYSGDLTATTTQIITGQVQPDEFNSASLNTSLWHFENPVGDCSVSQANGLLRIAVPAGGDHDSWGNYLLAPRLMQAAPNTDLKFGVKFNTVPAGRYAMDGLAVQGANNQSIRVDFQSNGSAGINIFACVTTAGRSTAVINKTVSITSPSYLFLERTGDTWTVSYSLDGTNWTVAGTFQYAMVVTNVGVSAGNAGTASGNAPAYTAAIDSFLNAKGTPPPDTTPPVQSNIQASPGTSTIDITWTTDENAIGAIDYGRTSQFELGRVSEATAGKNHSIRLSGLAPDTTYQFRVRSTDASNNVAQSNVLTAKTSSNIGSPIVDIWYGDRQSFGQLGNPQNWVNILGTVSDPDGMASLSYSLNGQSWSPLSIGPDQQRLKDPGDFNVEIDRRLLHNGDNQVAIKAVDSLGTTAIHTVIVNYAANVWPTTYTANWSNVSQVAQAAQVVDGRWQIQGDSVRTTQIGYDRLLAIGDMTWGDYEFTVPVTIHSYDPNSFGAPSYGAGLGMVMHWQGHTAYNDAQPRWGWTPAGATMWYAWYQDGSSYEELENTNTSTRVDRTLNMDVTYMWKGRVETNSKGDIIYSMKIWQEGQPEPQSWDFSGEGTMYMLTGSILLVAHNVDVSLGKVTVVPL